MHIHERGRLGEELAVNFLTSAGYSILERNWTFGRNEIDIICTSPNGILVFVEVKTRSSSYFGAPEQAVDQRKEIGIARAAVAYVIQTRHTGETRFDVVSVRISLPRFEGPLGKSANETEIHHLVDAFFPGL